jgi:hypothetical protein
MIELHGASLHTETILGIPPLQRKQFTPSGNIHLATQARCLKELEKENDGLKKLLAELPLGQALMQETASGFRIQAMVPFSFPESGI